MGNRLTNSLRVKELCNSLQSVKFLVMAGIIINLVVFDIIWFGLVYFGNYFIPASLLLLAAHLHFYSKIRGEVWLIVVITVIGIIVDSMLVHFNIFMFPNSNHIPLWLIALWACFGATICHSLKFLSGSKVLQFLVGAFLAPLSYIAGYKFDAVNFGLPLMSTYFVLFAVWGLLFVIFFALKNHLVSAEVNHA